MQSIFLTWRRLAAVSCLFLSLVACGGRVELLTGISENEANEVLAVLIDAGIKAGKLPGKEGMVSLDVDQSDVARAIGIMQTEGLPRDRFAKMGEVFRKEGLISSPLEERARFLWALSQELSGTVAQIDGVIKSRVHVVLPERSTGGDPAVPSSAAVFIKHKPGYNLEEAIPQIKRLVANSISGLTAEKVTVVLLPASGKAQESSDTSALSKAKAKNGNGKNGNGTHSGLLNGNLMWLFLAVVSLLIAGLGYLAWRKWGGLMMNRANPIKPGKATASVAESGKVIGADASS